PDGSRDVLEGAVAFVAVQSQRWCWLPLVLAARPRTGVDEQKVLMAVVIVVQKGDPGPHRLRQEFLAEGPIGMPGADACRLSDVGEAHGGNREGTGGRCGQGRWERIGRGAV